jgi:hypothetical protein
LGSLDARIADETAALRAPIVEMRSASSPPMAKTGAREWETASAMWAGPMAVSLGLVAVGNIGPNPNKSAPPSDAARTWVSEWVEIPMRNPGGAIRRASESGMSS